SSLARIDPRTNRIVKKIRIGSNSYGVAYGAGSVWVTSELDGTVRRINPRTNKVRTKIKAGVTPNGLVYAFGSLWVADLGGDTLFRINVKTNRVVKKIKIAKVDWITPSADALWVSSEAGQVIRVSPATGRIV